MKLATILVMILAAGSFGLTFYIALESFMDDEAIKGALFFSLSAINLVQVNQMSNLFNQKL